MKVTVLVENNTRIDKYLLGEPALSLFIETKNKKILFDCGYSDVVIKNAEKLGIELNQLDYIVLSHGHNDHSGGLKFLPPNPATKLIAHPNIFDYKMDENNVEYSCPIKQEELSQKYNLILTKEPYQLEENLYFLGEIKNNTSSDIDDSAIVYKSPSGLVIITGCSHAGILNTLRQAQRITQEDKIFTIIGGLHLIAKNDTQINKFGIFMEEGDISHIYPCHCCDLHSKILLSKFAIIKEVCVGDVINLP